MHAKYRVQFVQNKSRERLCIIVHRNGHVILQSPDSYKRLNKVVRSTKRFLESLAKGDYEFDVVEVPKGRPVGASKKK